MMKAHTRWSLTTCAVVCLSAGASMGMPQQTTGADRAVRQRVSASSGRPLADVVSTLEQRYGVPITYEDPPYDDDSQRKILSGGREPTFVPRGGPFSFEYRLDETGPIEQQLERILTALVQEYRPTSYAGQFQVSRTENMFHIIPVSRRVIGGQDVPYAAILNTELSFVAREPDEPVTQALEELCQELGRVAGITVIVGTVPTNVFDQTRVKGYTGKAAGRSHLVRILASTARSLSWQFFYDPNGAGMFVLNIHLVR